VHLTIAALTHLDTSFILRIIGDGPARPRLEQLVDRLGLRDRVIFLGRLSDEDVQRWFRTARVYVSMSAHEAFGITLYEALAAGARVVASDIPAFQEVAAAAGASIDLTGLRTEPAQLAHLIRTSTALPRAAQVLSAVVGWETVIDRTIALYQTMLHDEHMVLYHSQQRR
jgi:glycosyltransferase involved in cell wall biosynthesis